MITINKILISAVHTVLFLLLLLLSPSRGQQVAAEAGPGIDARVDSLLDRMTLEEKIGQLTLFTSDLTTTGPTMRDDYRKLINEGRTGAIFNAYGADYTRKLQKMAVENSRLGIPLLFGYDVIHGFRTIFPIPLAEAASWDPDLARRSAQTAAREAAAAGLHWTFAPMVDVSRDPRWGRIAESAGEDPYLNVRFAEERVRGFQGEDLENPETILATAKHFAAYGAAEGGRDYNTVNMSNQRLWEVYLPPFKAALDAGVGTFMTAFNEYNGVPATGSQYLFNTILRDAWNFEGFVVTDYTSIPEMIAHGAAAGETAAVEMAMNANVDMDMQSGLYLKELPRLVEEGRISEEQVDRSVRRILRLKYELGLFQDPYRYSDADREDKELLSARNRELARKVARESVVLLKNENNLLPLSRDISELAVIGPLADNQQELLGSWSAAGDADDNVTVLEGIRQKLGGETAIHYRRGSDITGTSADQFDEAVQAAEQAEVAIVVLGEEALMSGEAASRATLDLPGVQQELLEQIHATGTPVVFVMMNGRPLTITWADQHIPAILETWFLGTEGGHAIADILFGDDNPSGKLPVTFPRAVGQVPYYYNHKNTGRPMTDQKYTSKYIDVENSPLYPFGYGLSYTSFDYGGLQLSRQTMRPDDSLHIRVEVENTGKREGEEVVQLYIRDLSASVTRPIKEMRAFQKIKLQPGQEKTVSFTLTGEDFSFYNQELKKVVEPGRFKIFVGTNARDVLETELLIQ
ncbi:beta-glucosidase BglX [Fodinibius sediminis]|uniref:Periplasmic beta-glucosidase n=1 Tax=Fodinibius sediminis TaxID=1214077 RepID=A0A521CVN9_9BACT|nr:beta-glucosidase BglX [Fodinibius sediminis]SMO63506.1 beta-glucosidase [Fodinibius sediminis]